MSDPTPTNNTTARSRARSRSRALTPPPSPKNLPRCAKCRVEFGFLWNRQHHCRNCGQSVCSSCSESEIPVLEYDFEIPVRVCDMCKDDVLTRNAELLACASDDDEPALPAHVGTHFCNECLVCAQRIRLYAHVDYSSLSTYTPRDRALESLLSG
jgi:hypothetical protein